VERTQYIKNDKTYDLRRRPHEVRLWWILPLIVLALMGVYLIFSSIGKETSGKTVYDVSGEIDYKVYLKDNDYYEEKFLGKDLQYIASLINIVRADFSYKLAADEDLDAHYEYEIIADAKATERGDKTKVLYEKSEVIKQSEVANIKVGELTIREGVDIDYGKYSELMRNFRADFGVSADCFLDLKLVVKVDGAIKTEDTLAMNIPLSDQTIEITMDTDTITRQETVGEAKEVAYLKSLPLFMIGCIMLLTGIVFSVVVIYYYATRLNNDPYEKLKHKYLKEYDTFIVNGHDTIYELPTVIRVENFKELLDASQAENSPIIFLEVIPGEKSYFIVNGVNTTYRFTLSRAYQNKLAAQGEKED